MPVCPFTSSNRSPTLREQLAQRAAERDVPRNAGELLDLGVPALDAIVKIGRQDADVDRLDDILAEFLQPLVFFDFLLQRL